MKSSFILPIFKDWQFQVGCDNVLLLTQRVHQDIFNKSCWVFKKTIFQMISLKTWRIQKLLEFRLSFSCFHPKKVGTAQLTRLGIPLGMELGTSGRFWFKKEGTALPKEPGSSFENVHSASFPGLFLALLRSDDWRRISWENQIIQGR